MKFKDFCIMVKNKIVNLVKKLLSPILDRQWDLDPYKIAGFFFFYKAYDFSNKLFLQPSTLSDVKMGILGGIITALITIGTFMFNQGRKSDETLKV